MLPDEPRTVKPRKPNTAPWLPLIVVHRDTRSAFCELSGEVHGWTDLPHLFRSHPASVVIVPGAAHLVADLDPHYASDPRWQYRVTPVKRESGNPARRRRVVTDTLVNYFGWKAPGKRRGHWHYPVDPTLFTNAPLLQILPGLGPRDLLAWGRDLREWCAANDLRMSPTAGGIGGQLLRDPRWYPEARRKVPRATNTRARPELPGNHYRLYWPEHTTVNATYLDMSASNHTVAASLEFPCANTLFARGHFRTTETTETPVTRSSLWAPAGSRRYKALIQSYGLFRLQLNVPALKPDQFPPPYMEQAGRRAGVYVYSNELPLILSLGGEIEGIEAAWTSHRLDTGLNQYAQWALTEIATMSPERKRWAKVALLATYGNLAARARATEYGYRTALGGIPKEYPAGNGTLPALAKISDTEQEPPTVNVIHRGMIEAEQRRVVLNQARDLHGQGHTVICIYADAIMVKSDKALPLLPPPWRIDGHLTRVRFYAPTAFTSVERTKLPGMPREIAEHSRRIADIRRRI